MIFVDIMSTWKNNFWNYRLVKSQYFLIIPLWAWNWNEEIGFQEIAFKLSKSDFKHNR